ncbi:MAG TPA: mucoidy inhibitor MuiA family protein, partial [Thermodesulfobacteriota bacterium]|nr:mucoidy inhibitor MuiA family protein [Thermodesulfobacteriota bacterium]
MRRTVFLFPLLVVSLFLSLSAGAVEAATSSRVDRVILYPDMAEVTRVAEVAGTEGEVVLSGLTATLLPETVSAKVIRGSARIAGISVEDVFRPDPAEGRVRELSRLIEELTDGKRSVEGERDNLKREKALLESGVSAVFSPAGGKERTRLTVPEIEASLALFRTRAKGVDEAILARDREIRGADRKIDAARKELEKIRVPRPMQEKAVHLTLSRPGPCRIAVTFLVSSAGFSPRYDVRLSPTKGTLSFELTGEAWQRTGEEWKGTVLAFSTTRPRRMAQLPPLPAWEIDFARPAPVYREMMSRPSMAKIASDVAKGDDGMDLPAPAPSVARRFASMEVTLPDRQDLSGVGER